MTKDNELLPCPFCGGDCYINHVWNRNEGFTSFGVNCTRCSADKRGFDNKDDAIDFWNTRAVQPQPPVIEGPVAWQVYNPLVKSWTTTYHDADKVMALKADGWEIRPLYTQGQTAQHVDLDALKDEVASVVCMPGKSGTYTGMDRALIGDAINYLASRGMIVTAQEGFDKLVEILEREPQHKPRLAALLREESVIDKQPTEDAQRALDQMHLIVFDGCDDADKVMETIRAALARGLGE